LTAATELLTSRLATRIEMKQMHTDELRFHFIIFQNHDGNLMDCPYLFFERENI